MPANVEEALAEFQRAITPQRLRAMRLIHLAFPLSLVVFGFVLAVVASSVSGKPPTGSPQLAPALTVANIVVFCGAWAAGAVVFNALLAPGRVARAAQASAKSAAESCLDQLQKALVLRLACLDASACFGFVVCILLVLWGVLPAERIYWLNAFPAIVLAAYALYTLPSIPRLRVLFLVKIARQFGPR